MTVSSTAPLRRRPSPISFGARAVELDQPDPDLRNLYKIIAVDPGLQGTGVAVFVDGTLLKTEVCEVPHAYRDRPWPARADYLVSYIMNEYVKGMVLGHELAVVCEMMEFQGAGARGLGWTKGDMQKTTYFVGLLAGRCYPAPFHAVPVHCWKGQLPKRVVQDRIEKRLGRDMCRALAIESHAWDAVGIGMWSMGNF